LYSPINKTFYCGRLPLNRGMLDFPILGDAIFLKVLLLPNLSIAVLVPGVTLASFINCLKLFIKVFIIQKDPILGS
jgi:hypothetical protein